MTANILVYDVGSTYTKASAFLLEQGRISFLCRGQFPTTLEDVMQGVTHAREMIESSGVAIAPDAACYATCSAAGGLRMIAMGYMPRVTAKAAKEVAMCAGARVLEVVCHEDAPEYREEILREIRPNIVLLAGGTDGGDVESVGAKAVQRRMKQPQAVTYEELEAYAERLEQKPDTIAETPAEQDMDYAMTVCAVELAMKRHAGFFAQEYDPVMGTVPGVATGRDLRGVRHIIAVGGVFAHAPAERGVEILKEPFSDPGISLLPEQPSFTVDSNYILYALGAIGQHHPDEVMRYMKENIGSVK